LPAASSSAVLVAPTVSVAMQPDAASADDQPKDPVIAQDRDGGSAADQAANPVPTQTATGKKPSAVATAKKPDDAAAKKPAADCDPPYTIDAAGVKRFKPQCLK